MTYLILYVGTKLRKRLVVAVGTEDRVITEALCPTPLVCYLALYNTVEELFLFYACATTRTDVFLQYYRAPDQRGNGAPEDAGDDRYQRKSRVDLGVIRKRKNGDVDGVAERVCFGDRLA